MDTIQTRISLGSQISEALDDLVTRRAIDGWMVCSHADRRMGYRVDGPGLYDIPFFTPGEIADWLNYHGYDIRLGKPAAQRVEP